VLVGGRGVGAEGGVHRDHFVIRLNAVL